MDLNLINILAQAGIAIFGLSAIFLAQSAHIDYRRWASVLGLLGQPLWFTTSYISESWGIFILCFFYTFAWGKGFYIHWISKSAYQELNKDDLSTSERIKLYALMCGFEKTEEGWQENNTYFDKYFADPFLRANDIVRKQTLLRVGLLPNKINTKQFHEIEIPKTLDLLGVPRKL